MRPTFFQELYKQMQINKDIVAITGDLGFGGWDFIQKDFPDRFFNVGAAEFSMIGIACGMALEGKVPFVYTITPFFYRGFELLRTYVNHEKIPIKLVGSGRDSDYKHDGFSHFAGDVGPILSTLPNIEQLWPHSNEEIPGMVEEMVNNGLPTFISLAR